MGSSLVSRVLQFLLTWLSCRPGVLILKMAGQGTSLYIYIICMYNIISIYTSVYIMYIMYILDMYNIYDMKYICFSKYKTQFIVGLVLILK